MSCGKIAFYVCSHAFLIAVVVVGLLVYESYTFGSPKTVLDVREPREGTAFYGVSAQNLSDATQYVWLQVADLHIRGPQHPATLAFRTFANEVVPVVDPPFGARILDRAITHQLCTDSSSFSETYTTGRSSSRGSRSWFALHTQTPPDENTCRATVAVENVQGDTRGLQLECKVDRGPREPRHAQHKSRLL